MKQIAVIVILWIVILGVGIVGLFNQQTISMSICLFTWTPLSIAFGYFWRAAGLRVVVSDDPPRRAEQRPAATQQPSRIAKRESRL